ncbi:beta-xylosidase [Streptomyces sp. NPDC051582]|uniref:beta-xylosidase n=1 Tax=Streptomyces sp. NPDC051582 TaxID=3155167 RepID=UPI0034369012
MAFGVAALAATTGGVLSPPAAAESQTPAGRVEFPTRCLPPQEAALAPADGPTTALITADDPAPEVGDTVTVTYQVTRTPAVNPVAGALPADVLTPTGRILLGGAQSGEVTVVGAKRNDSVQAGAELPAVTMTGTFTVTAPGGITLAPGDYALHTSHLLDLDTTCAVTGAPVSARLTASPPPATPGGTPTRTNLRSVALGTAYGKPGAAVEVTGAGFAPGAAVTVAGRAGAAETADRVAATADDRGEVRARLPVTDRATTAVVAYEGARWSAREGSGPAAYTVLAAAPPRAAAQEVTALVADPGALSLTQTGASITLGALPYGAGGAAPGRIGTVTVKDARGGTGGWSLIGKVTAFTGSGGAVIPGASLSWTPTCTAAPGSASRCAAGSAGAVGPEGAVLASAPDAASVGGTFTIDAAVTLTLPPYTPPGAYRAVLTLTLS